MPAEGTSKKDSSRALERNSTSRNSLRSFVKRTFSFRRRSYPTDPNLERDPNCVGVLKRQNAEKKLENAQNADFLIRYSPNLNSYVLSMKLAEEVKHIPIRGGSKGYRSTDDQLIFPRAQDLIDYYKQHAQIDASRPPLTPISSNSPYINLEELHAYPWFMGRLDRDTAETLISGLPEGTFLLRFSQSQPKHAITLCHENEVKHLVIENFEEKFFFQENQLFQSVVELVTYYENHSLSKVFRGIRMELKYPIKSLILGYALVLADYEATNDKTLSLKMGEKIMILSKGGTERGWWKGKIGKKIGYFPFSYVCEIRKVEQRDISDTSSLEEL